MEELEHGKRFNQFPEGHDHYEKTVKEAVAIVEARLEVFKMKSLLDGHMVPASVNVYTYNGDGNYYALIERECNECAGTGHKGADLCERGIGYKQLDPLLKN
ncbi:hypothetical protein ACLB1Q_34670 [Escherichia coli]